MKLSKTKTPEAPAPIAHPMGAIEVADFLGVKRATVQQWSFRDKQAQKEGRKPVLPEADYTVGGFPAWERSTIIQWALDSKRLEEGDPRAEGFTRTPEPDE